MIFSAGQRLEGTNGSEIEVDGNTAGGGDSSSIEHETVGYVHHRAGSGKSSGAARGNGRFRPELRTDIGGVCRP